MTQHESETAAEYLADLLSSDQRLTRRVAVEALCETFALDEEEAGQVWKERNGTKQTA